MATAAGTAVDLQHGNSNRIDFGGVAAEVFNLVDASVAAADTWTFTTKLKTVTAVIGIPYPGFTWAQSGQTLTITIANDGETWASVNLNIIVLGTPL